MSPEPTFRDFGIIHRLSAYLRGRPSCTYLTSWPYTLQGIPSASEGSPPRLGKLTGTGRRPCPFSGRPCLVPSPAYGRWGASAGAISPRIRVAASPGFWWGRSSGRSSTRMPYPLPPWLVRSCLAC